MAAWLNGGKALALDLESTGTDVFNDRIVTACAAIVADGQALYERQWLVAVDVDIPKEASDVHHITTEYAREHGVPAAEAIPEIANAVRYAVHSGMVIIAYNACFDLSMVNAECVRHGLGTLEEFCGRPIGPVIDPFCIDKAVDRFRKGSRKLVDTCKFLGVELSDEDAHSAGADAMAAARVAEAIAKRCDLPADQLRELYADRRFPHELVRAFQSLGGMTVGQLHEAQVRWYAEQAESLGAYWRREAEQKRHEAALVYDDGEVNATAIESAAVLEQEAAELDARVASLSPHWPIRPVEAVSAP